MVALACCYQHVDATGRDGGSAHDAHLGGDVGRAPDAPLAGELAVITVGNKLNTEPISDLPVPVRLDGSALALGGISDPATQLVFTDGMTTLPYDVELWDPAAISIVWILIPMLPQTETATVTLSVAPEPHAVGNMWPGYALVSHFQPVGRQAIDSSPGGHLAATPDGTADFGSGLVGSGVAFTADDGSLQFGNTGDLFASWTKATVDFWIHPDYTNATPIGSDVGTVIAADGSLDLVDFTNAQDATDSDVAVTLGMFGTASTFSLPSHAWSHLVVSYDGGGVSVFVNGKVVTTPLAGATLTGSTFTLGRSTNNFLIGTIDELRIGSAGTTLPFVQAEEAAAGNTFVTVTTP